MAKQKIVILTGAGISAESGISTFRDSDGLWHGHKIEDVASPEGFRNNPQLVLDFYNQRRTNCIEAQPNNAHLGLVKLEEKYEVTIVTQNVDDLHERGGSSNVIHLHGELLKKRSTSNEFKTFPYQEDIKVGDLAPDGGFYRPFIVWFGEAVPKMDLAIEAASKADVFIIIGTSLLVYPAAGLAEYTPIHCNLFIIDKNIPTLTQINSITKIEEKATEGVSQLLKILL
jgi:NAD-dependent deacetylase